MCWNSDDKTSSANDVRGPGKEHKHTFSSVELQFGANNALENPIVLEYTISHAGWAAHAMMCYILSSSLCVSL